MAGSGVAPDHDQRKTRARLSLEGLSVGDAFGQCFFAFGTQVLIAARTAPPAPWQYTDDTTMALSIVEVLEQHGRIDQDALAEAFARRYAREPNRGYGATAHLILRAIGRGCPWREASAAAFGGEGSMGNGGAMRVGPLGAYFADDLDAVVQNARASAEVTHGHSEGQAGAIAVAVAAAVAGTLRGAGGAAGGQELIRAVIDRTPPGATRLGLSEALKLPFDASVRVATEVLGNGSRVCAFDTVPFAIWCAARHLDSYEDALWETVSGLGDRDTTCAIVGSIVAMAVPEQGVPAAWRRAREPLP